MILLDHPATELTTNLDWESWVGYALTYSYALPLCIMWYRQSQPTEKEDLLYFRDLPSSLYIKFHSEIEIIKTAWNFCTLNL